MIMQKVDKLTIINFVKYWLALIFIPVLQILAQNMPVPAIPFSPLSYVCYRTAEEITIDGILDEPSWKKAQWTENFVDIEGLLKPIPLFRTRVKMLWDMMYLYIAAELEEPDVWATLTERDAIIFYDNDFEIFIDPDGDTHNYYEIELNALNTVWDLLIVKPYRDGGPAVHGWDINKLKTSVHVNGTLNIPGDRDQGWNVEVAIPWLAMKECNRQSTPPRQGDQWRVNFSRVEWKTEILNGKYQKVINPSTGKPYPEDNWVWAPQGLINMHYPEMWGILQFSEKFVGIDEDKFIFKSDEKIKWTLRMIYYAEKNYFNENKKFMDLDQLIKNLGMKLDNYSKKLSIFLTPNLFEAIIISDDSKTLWHINQDGLTWSSSL